MDNILTKKIQIVDMKPQFIPPLNKNKYFIKGNDGIAYELWDENLFNQRKIGEFIDIQYQVRTNQGRNGRIYTNYIIQTPKVSQGSPGAAPNDSLRQVMDRLNMMEKNIIAAIQIHSPEKKITPNDVPSVFDKINEDAQVASQDQTATIPIIEDNGPQMY